MPSRTGKTPSGIGTLTRYCAQNSKPHTQLTMFTFSLPCPLSLIIYSAYSTRMCHPLRHLLPIAICHSLFATCHLPFAFCHLLFAIPLLPRAMHR